MDPKIDRGLKQLQLENKVVHQYESTDIQRCHILLLDKYISKMPQDVKKKDNFYLKPKATVPVDPCLPWFTSVPLGKNKLGDMMKSISMEVKLDKPLTNHSLRAYSVTKMFKDSVPEKIIMERSGHQSMEGVRNYERTSTAQELQVCQALSTRQPSENK